MLKNLVETRETNKDNGTSFHEQTIYATFDELKDLFGKYKQGDLYKTHVEWVMEFDDVVFTVYDWKESKNPAIHNDINFYWNIGSHSKIGSIRARELIDNLLEEESGK